MYRVRVFNVIYALVGCGVVSHSPVLGKVGGFALYDAIQYAYADLLNSLEDVKSFRVNVLLDGIEGGCTSDFGRKSACD